MKKKKKKRMEKKGSCVGSRSLPLVRTKTKQPSRLLKRSVRENAGGRAVVAVWRKCGGCAKTVYLLSRPVGCWAVCGCVRVWGGGGRSLGTKQKRKEE